MVLLAAALLTAGCGDGRSATSAPADEPTASAAEDGSIPGPPVDPADDGVNRILFAGDSLMEEIHATMTAALGDAAETRFILSPRLIREEGERVIWQTALDDFHPDVVVVLFSHWERLVVGAQTADDIDDVDAYAGFVALPFIDYITDNGAEVLWLSAPPLRDQRITAVYAVLNDAYRTATAMRPSATFVDLGPALTGGTGTYSDTLATAAGTLERARNIDGIHLCPGGAVAVAETALGALHELVRTTPAPGWQDGAWRNEAPFDEPEVCPATT